jgi:hypothetical protein
VESHVVIGQVGNRKIRANITIISKERYQIAGFIQSCANRADSAEGLCLIPHAIMIQKKKKMMLETNPKSHHKVPGVHL